LDAWKQTVAENLAALRKSHHMTQLQLAETLHYSDKAVSKWERGESLPDLTVMKQLAELYGITLDDFFLTEAERAEKQKSRLAETPQEPASSEEQSAEPKCNNHNRLIIAGMAMMLVWLIATLIFVVLDAIVPELEYGKFLFLYAAPITAIVLLAVFLTFYSHRLWKLFLIGIPAQLIIILWSRLKPSEKQPPKQEPEA